MKKMRRDDSKKRMSEDGESKRRIGSPPKGLCNRSDNKHHNHYPLSSNPNSHWNNTQKKDDAHKQQRNVASEVVVATEVAIAGLVIAEMMK